MSRLTQILDVVLAYARVLARPFSKQIRRREPVIVAWLISAAITVAAHYGLHLTAAMQTYVALGVTAVVHGVVRQLVSPARKSTNAPGC